MIFECYSKGSWEADHPLPVLVTLDRYLAETHVLTLGKGAVLRAVQGGSQRGLAVVSERVLTGKLGLDAMDMEGIF